MVQNYLIIILIVLALSIIVSTIFDPKPFKSKDVLKFTFLIKLIGISLIWPIFLIISLYIVYYKLKELLNKKKY